MEVKVIGAGLAGCEAAWQLAKRGIGVQLYEMKPQKMRPAHHSQDFAELVCSNSLRGDRLENAVGLLKEELRRCDSLIMQCAEATRVEAGGCLAVDRKGFSQLVTEKIRSNPLITVVSEEVSKAIGEYFGTDYLHFFDAAAPLVTAESVDMDLAWWQSRYDRGTPDYVNCAMDKQQYEAFVKEMISAEEAEVHGFEDKRVFEGCMPVEVFAGQMTGVEGYGESSAYGFLAAVAIAAKVQGKEPVAFPKTTAIGALGLYISDGSIENFQPMNINFSIISPLEYRVRKKAEKNLAISQRALEQIDALIAQGF